MYVSLDSGHKTLVQGLRIHTTPPKTEACSPIHLRPLPQPTRSVSCLLPLGIWALLCKQLFYD